jgi:hypothetical protein
MAASFLTLEGVRMFVRSLIVALFLLAMGTSLHSVANDTTSPAGAKKAPAAPTDIAEIAGYYICKGQEAAGKNYSGVAVITKKADIYVVQWMVGTGSGFSGIGIRQGNNLAVSWTLQGNAGLVRGVNLYRIEAGPRLVGRWATLPGPGVMQSETLTFLKNIEDDE